MASGASEIAQRMAEYRTAYAWHTDTQRQAALTANTEASDFAKMLIQAFVVLHGGALVAFPTLLPLAGVALTSSPRLVIWLAGLLIAGLVSATVAGLAGFFAWANAADGGLARLGSSGLDAFVATFQGVVAPEEIAESQAEAAKHEKSAEHHFKRYGAWRLIGICAILASLACFIAASVIGLVAAWPTT